MLEIQGKYNTVKIFTDVIDQPSISQIYSLLEQPYVEGSKIRMMPDIHAGAGCTIGTTMTIIDKICPNLVGVDIGCGMKVVKIKEKHIELQQLDKVIRETIPSGFNIRKYPHNYCTFVDLDKLYCSKHIDKDKAYNSIGTLGGGNHFIEADKDDEGNIYIVIHSGSRHFGLEVAVYYQNAAYKQLISYSKEEIDKVIEQLKAEGKQKEISSRIKNMKKPCKIPKPLAYVENDLLEQYLYDMEIAQCFADTNRNAMMHEIIKNMGLHVVDEFTTIHNYIDIENKILRKGAVSAQEGEKLIIPINMRDGSLICTGKGNPDWNFSAPHGAGRLMSRKEARETFTVSEFKKQMEGIYSTSINKDTLDECPMTYKSINDIIDNIGPTVTIDKIIKPIYNFKAGEGERRK